MIESDKKTIISNLFWKFLERGGYQSIVFVVQIVLARLLTPSDFGNIAIISVFINLANVFVQSGFNTALIQKEILMRWTIHQCFFEFINICFISWSYLAFITCNC